MTAGLARLAPRVRGKIHRAEVSHDPQFGLAVEDVRGYEDKSAYNGYLISAYNGYLISTYNDYPVSAYNGYPGLRLLLFEDPIRNPRYAVCDD